MCHARRVPSVVGTRIREKGVIVTAKHTIPYEDEVAVGLTSGEKVKAKVAGRDLRNRMWQSSSIERCMVRID